MKKILVLLLVGGGLAWWGYGDFGGTPQNQPEKPIASSDTVSISRMTSNPREYSGTTVTVTGRITQSLNVGIGAYVLNDGTGRLLVQTNEAVPSAGQKTTVTGEISQMAKLGGAQLLVLKERRLHSDGQ